MKRIKSDRILLPEGIFDGYVYFEGKTIACVTKEALPVEEELDFTGYYVSAGWIDMHTHGGGGFPFEGSVDDVVEGCNFHLRRGTTSICPTVSAAPFESMARSARNIKAASTDPRLLGTILGSHMEGPYLSLNQSGAQCPDHITEPIPSDYQPLIEELGDSIARWSYAPERDRDGAFTEALAKNGILPSAGHTDAIYPELLRAYEKGCCLVTHLYSCTSTITRDHGFRRLGVIETAYLLDDMYVEIICDGKHLPPELIRLIYKIKGPQRIALVTDSLALAGTAEKQGRMQSTDFIIEDGVCKLLDRSAFAGSIATADRLIRVAVKEAEIPLLEAVKMMTEIPAEIMKLSHKGRLSKGMDADMVVFDEDIQVKQVIALGNTVL